MDRFVHRRLQRENPGQIIFEVVKDGERATVMVPAKHAARETAFMPRWPLGDLDGLTINLRTRETTK